MNNPVHAPHFAESLKIRDIRLFVGSISLFTMASRALAVVIGFQIYQITHSALALGWLGLVEAIPAISLVLFGGYAADHYNRRRILLITRAASILCAVALIVISRYSGPAQLVGLYGVIFLAGVARGFTDPASSAFEAQVVPRHLTVNASSWISSAWISAAVVGPALIGFAFDAWGAQGSYAAISVGFLLAWICTLAITDRPLPKTDTTASLAQSIGMGWHFVAGNQPLLASMYLDLLGVLFGGAVALLPIYAEDILKVGATGLGFLNAATSLGSIVVTLIGTRHPPIHNAGRNLLWSVFGFGVCIIAFAFSRNFWLSMACLFLSGVFDGVSIVIRRSMIRLLSPDHLRGRVAAVNSIFICASNELGALESGMLAAWIGAVPCVAIGGVLTLMVSGITAMVAPQLRELRFDREQFHPQTAGATPASKTEK